MSVSQHCGMRLLYSYAIEFQSVFFAFSNLCIFIASTDTVEQAKGIALVPKLACDVMSGEVNRVLLLTKNGVIPLPYIVPRKVCCHASPSIVPCDNVFDEHESMIYTTSKKTWDINTLEAMDECDMFFWSRYK